MAGWFRDETAKVANTAIQLSGGGNRLLRRFANRGPFIQYYVDEDHDLAIHNVVCTDRDFARTAILRLGGWVSKSRSDTHCQNRGPRQIAVLWLTVMHLP